MPCKPPVESSPRMQEALPSAENHSKHYRIIPADAGSTTTTYGGKAPTWDHLRGCGEHKLSDLMTVREGGSSPRMRGAQVRSNRKLSHQRIIPADAGSTLIRLNMSCSDRDHPRGCGERAFCRLLHHLCSGSSPRMRGAHILVQRFINAGRIIPADAGSTV